MPVVRVCGHGRRVSRVFETRDSALELPHLHQDGVWPLPRTTKVVASPASSGRLLAPIGPIITTDAFSITAGTARPDPALRTIGSLSFPNRRAPAAPGTSKPEGTHEQSL